MNIEEKLVKYDKTGDSLLIVSESDTIGSKELATIVRNIIDWLELEHKRTLWIQEDKKTRLKPMELRMQYPWCIALQELVVKEPLFSKYFSITGNKFDFLESISEDEKKRIREYVYIHRRRCTML